MNHDRAILFECMRLRWLGCPMYFNERAALRLLTVNDFRWISSDQVQREGFDAGVREIVEMIDSQ